MTDDEYFREQSRAFMKMTVMLLGALQPNARDQIMNEAQEMMENAKCNYDFVEHARKLAESSEEEIVKNMAALLGLPLLTKILVDLPCRHLDSRKDCGICGANFYVFNN